MLKRILLILLIIFVAIQFIVPAKNIHPGPQPNDISTVYPVPADVDSILVVACNDCHTNNTRYPWYNNLQPVAWFYTTEDRKSTRLNSSHANISYAVFCLK